MLAKTLNLNLSSVQIRMCKESRCSAFESYVSIVF